MRGRKSVPCWIAVEWSQDGLLAWAMDRDDSVLMKVRSARGLAQIADGAFETVLDQVIHPWLIEERTTVVVGGLSGLETDAIQRPSALMSCDSSRLELDQIKTSSPRMALYAIPPFETEGDADAVKGHESLIWGVASDLADFRGALCVPGGHTSWVGIDHGSVGGAMSFMTVALADMLAPPGDGLLLGTETKPDMTPFLEAVETALSRPDRITHDLIAAKADPDPSKSRLKGLLIGLELAGARGLWTDQDVLVSGGSPWSPLYEAAIQTQGGSALSVDADEMILAGLKRAYRGIPEPAC